MMRCQSLKITDRSDAFKSYAKPLVLNQSQQNSSLREKLISPCEKDLNNEGISFRPRELKRESKIAEAL